MAGLTKDNKVEKVYEKFFVNANEIAFNQLEGGGTCEQTSDSNLLRSSEQVKNVQINENGMSRESENGFIKVSSV